MTTEAIWFYNLDNGRPDALVNREIGKILDTKPLVLVGAEATGLQVAQRPDYHTVRDSSSKSRANMVAFVRKSHAHFRFGHWVDLQGTWARTKYAGVHEARSFPVFWANGMKFAGVHLPPRNAHPRLLLQGEAIHALASIRNLDIAVGDFNAKAGDLGPGPDRLARKIGARTVGDRIDCAVVASDLLVSRVAYPTRLGRRFRRVAAASDHGHAFHFSVEC